MTAFFKRLNSHDRKLPKTPGSVLSAQLANLPNSLPRAESDFLTKSRALCGEPLGAPAVPPVSAKTRVLMVIPIAVRNANNRHALLSP